jgi:hypothetical protein
MRMTVAYRPDAICRTHKTKKGGEREESMGVRHARWWPGLFATLLVLQLFSAWPAYAEEEGVTIFSVTQQDLNGDGRPDLTIIDCAFATDHDRIYVVDQGGDMRASTNWREATDFSDDVWLYDIGARGNVQLIVVYRVEDGHETAYVYDDQDGDGQVKYQRAGTQVTILESPYWTARIISSSRWFLPDGRLDLNVRVELDGPIPTLDRMPENYRQGWMKHDGQKDVEFEEVADSDGIARYALRHLVAPSPEDWGFEHAWLYTNEGRYPTNVRRRAFFPFLPIPVDSHDSRYVNLRYFDLPPDVAVDWMHGKVMAVGLEGYPIGHGYHFNDNRYITKGQVNNVAFESPQAYYDLANNHDAFPELHIRFFTHPPDDTSTWSLKGKEAVPWQSISYDWNLFNPETLRWDFKVGLGGNHTIDSVVRFRDFAVRTVPFEELPRWITERDWKLTTFVAREGAGYESSEGIYEWQADTGDDPEAKDNHAIEARDATFRYMLGVTTTPPDAYFTSSHTGFRAERHFASPIQPYLYFSPLDRKLHLRGAEVGIWNIDDRSMIRYANLDGDAYLDQWQYFENGKLRRQLYAAGSYLIYAGENEVLLKQANVAPSLFEMLPPRDHQEWLALGQQLKANQPDFAPTDFKAMLAQFDGPEWHITGAILHGFRPVGEGFRFVLELQRGFGVIGSSGPDLHDIRLGSYAVSYHNTFSVEPLSPPALSAALADVTPTELEPTTLQVALRNDGQEDLPQATLELWAAPPQGRATLVATQTVALLAQVPITPTLQWAPPLAGQWALTSKIIPPGGRSITFEPTQVRVLPARTAAPGVMVAASTSPETLPFVLFGLISFAAIAALIFWWQWGRFATK